jgi:hypothetical protein
MHESWQNQKTRYPKCINTIALPYIKVKCFLGSLYPFYIEMRLKNVILSPERSEGTASEVKNLDYTSVEILRFAQNDKKMSIVSN